MWRLSGVSKHIDGGGGEQGGNRGGGESVFT